MTEGTKLQLPRKLLKYSGRVLKSIWEFNEKYWLSPLAPVICFSVVFHVVGALFPPIEQSCALDAGVHSPSQNEVERLTHEPS